MTPEMINCIIYGNTAVTGDEIHVVSGSPIADYCNIGGISCPVGVICTGCLFDEDPLFVGGDPYDYHLDLLSPCIDQGTDDTGVYPSLPIDDIDGDARPEGDGYDIGSDEVLVCVHHGDVNFDGSITAGDAQMAFNIALGIITPTLLEECAADCNADGSVTAGDAQQIFGAVMGMDSCVDSL